MKRGLFVIVGTLIVFVLGIAINPFISSRVADGQPPWTDTATVASFAFGLKVAGLYIAADETVRHVQIVADGNMNVFEFNANGQIESVSQGIWQARGLNSLTVDGVLVGGTTGEQTVVTLAFDENLESVTVALPDGTLLFTAQRVTMP